MLRAVFGGIKKVQTKGALLLLASVIGFNSLTVLAPLFVSHASAMAIGNTTVKVSPTDMHNWTTEDTRPGGTSSFVADATAPLGHGALHLTTNATTTAKAQLTTYFTPVPLTSVSNSSMSYKTKQNSAGFSAGDASYQLYMYMNGTSGFNTLTYEPYVSEGNAAVHNGAWQSWDSGNGLFYSSHDFTGVGGNVQTSQGTYTYTLDQIRAYFPTATVIGLGANIGSNNPSYDVETDAFAFNGTTYDFEDFPTPNDVYVNCHYTATSAGGHSYGNDAFSTIAAGVNAVAVGGTVHVAACEYDESGININKTMTLKGAQSGNSGVNRTHGSASEAWVVGTTTYTPTFDVNADNVVINGFDFGPLTDGAASGPIGVDLGDSDGAVVKDSVFMHNQRGISLNGATNVTINDNQISNNNADPESNAGIWGDNVSTIAIKGNQLDGASNTAINLQGSDHISITDNTAKNDDNLAVIWNDSDVTVSRNVTTGLTGSKVFVTGSHHVTVTRNTLNGPNTSTGVYVANYAGQSSDVNITRNDLSGLKNGIYLDDNITTDTLVATHNNFAGDVTAGVNANDNTTRLLVNASNSWWGNASGPYDPTAHDGSQPDTNLHGTGSRVYGSVKYANWCSSAACASEGGSGGDGDDGGTGTGGDNGGTTGSGGDQSTGSSTASSPSTTAAAVNATPARHVVSTAGGSTSNTSADTSSTGSTTSDNASTDTGVLGTTSQAGTSSAHTDKTKNTSDNKQCFKILGICWYWWIPIVIVVGYIAYRYTRHAREDQTTSGN